MNQTNDAQKAERVAYINGEIVPESDASVSIRDMGLVYGDSVFDTERTFGGRLFRLQDHIDRLYKSLEYAKIDPGMSQNDMIEATQRLVALNIPHLRDGEDYWVTQRVTTGRQPLDGESPVLPGATIIIDCIPLPLRARARSYQDGIYAVVANRKRIAPQALSANVKSNNYLNMMLAQREVQADHPGAWALMCDVNGNLAEGAGCNFFIVSNGEVVTPTDEFVLQGVSRQVVFEICDQADIAITRRAVTLDEALEADEAFFSSTSLCVCPVSRLNDHNYTAGHPGPVTDRIMKDFARMAGFDFVAQYLAFASEAGASTGL